MNRTPNLSCVRDVFERAKLLSHFRSKYARHEPIESFADFLKLPPADKADLSAAEPELRSLLRRQGLKAYLFASGGTTSKPKLSFIPPHMFLEDIIRCWNPLDNTDVLCNMFTPGKLWSSHYFYNALGELSVSETIALGDINTSEYGEWTDFLLDRGVTALAGTPTMLKDLLHFCRSHGRTLPTVHTLLWVGEKFDQELLKLKRDVLPNAGTWGLYGSTETWVVGYNFPDCPLDTFHVLPYQYLEIEDRRVLLTNTHPDCLNPLLRYQMGDSAVWERCPCRRATPAVRILGRNDETFKFRGTLVEPEALIRTAVDHPGVTGAQMVVKASSEGRENLELAVVSEDAARLDLGAIRKDILGRSLDLNNLFDLDPGGFSVVAVPRLQTNARTGKTAAVLREGGAR